MSVYKTIEVIAGSSKGWEAAAGEALKAASKSINNITSIWIKDQSATVTNGEITEYRVNAKITFRVGK